MGVGRGGVKVSVVFCFDAAGVSTPPSIFLSVFLSKWVFNSLREKESEIKSLFPPQDIFYLKSPPSYPPPPPHLFAWKKNLKSLSFLPSFLPSFPTSTESELE